MCFQKKKSLIYFQIILNDFTVRHFEHTHNKKIANEYALDHHFDYFNLHKVEMQFNSDHCCRGTKLSFKKPKYLSGEKQHDKS